MFVHAIVFLLVNTYTCTFGIPLQPGITNGPLASSLAELANHCENSILADQIISKLNDCNVTVPPYNEKQFNCLIFYDINIQLCDAVASSKLAVGDEQMARMNEEVDVAQLCETAKGWRVTNIPEYSLFKKTVEQVFNNRVVCLKACGVDDVTSQDSNFFCKYYKWGLEMLGQSPSVAPSQLNNDASPSANEIKTVQNIPMPVLPVSDVSVVKNNISNSNDLLKVTPINTTKIKQVVVSNDQKKVEKESSPQGLPPIQQNSHPENVVSGIDAGDIDIKVHKNEEEVKGASVHKSEIQTAGEDSQDPSFEGLDKPLAAELPSQKKQIELKEEIGPNQDIVPANESKPPIAVNIKAQGNEDEYQDSDEGREGIDSQGGDDGDDPMLEDLNTKQDIEQSKSSSKRIEAPVSSYNGEFFPGAFQEGYTDGDDHFFPFFLTAVIVVVILYVLYHNKNKFLGLIVEGRQPGRRRNSRGHAYRRLDTLEQAMSTSSSAPPSKIIY